MNMFRGLMRGWARVPHRGERTMTSSVRRPGVVTFIGVVLYIQAFFALVAAIVLLAFATRLANVITDISTEPVTSGALLLSGISELILAALLFVVGRGIMQGNPGARLFVAVVEGLRMVVALAAMLYYHDGAFVESGVVTILIGVFVLWALYGNDRANDYFDSGARDAAPPAIPAQAGPPARHAAPEATETPRSS
jgi:xanthine/uracil permease